MPATTFPSHARDKRAVETSRNARMSSLKRSLSVADSPRAKRFLSSALAAELQALRISNSSVQPASTEKYVFGSPLVNSSPFLTTSQHNDSLNSPHPAADCASLHGPGGVTFGNEFAESLSDATYYQPGQKLRQTPEVITPESSTSSLCMALDDPNPDDPNMRAAAVAPLEEYSDDVIVEDMDTPPNSENRIVVYRPPVRTSPQALSQLNASLPDGRYVHRNPRADEWMVKEVQNDSMKRKMALVPWRGYPRKKFCDSVQSKAILMPWHGMDTIQPNMEQSGLEEQPMEIEDVS